MRSLVSFRALAAALVVGLGLQACGGETGKLNDGAPGTGGRGLESGGDAGRSAPGGMADSGGTSSGGNSGSAGSAGAQLGGSGTGGDLGFVKGGYSGMFSTGPTPCDSLGRDTNYKGESTGLEWCQDQTMHRVSNAECAVFVPRADKACRGSFVNSCASDADCTEKPLGGCFAQGQGLDVCGCEYGCRTDEDCEGGGICRCTGDVGKCLPATCRTDADCGPGLQCRSYQHPDSDSCDDVRFECQTTEDTCQSSYYCAGFGERCVSDATGVHHCRQHYCNNE